MKNQKSIVLIFVLIIFMLLMAAPAQAEENEEHLISNFFFYTDLREAFNEITLQTGINIIADESVRGVITLDLDQVPLEKALQMMLLSGGYTFRKIDDYYLVSVADPRSPTFQHLAETETIRLRYISAGEARALLPGHYDRYLRSSSDRDIITITATPEIIESFKIDLDKIDTPAQEIMIQMIVTEVSTELLKERGADFFGFLNQTQDDTFFQLLYDRSGFASQFGDNFGELETRLRFLEQQEDVNIRANPRVLVNDRETATLFIGEEQVIIIQPNDTTARLERVDVGVSINVTPRVLTDDQLMLSVNPDISHFSEERQERLVVKRSEMNTTVYAENGKTLTLGGMTLSREVEFTSAVPILGDIPVLRWLFRQETERESERELMIFLTPEIVRK